MSATAQCPPGKSPRPFRPVRFGCLSFAVGGPLVAAVIWPAVMLVAWSVIDGPSWDTVGIVAAMVPMVLFVSFAFGYFLPAMLTGAIMGAIGTRLRRRWFVPLGTIVGGGAMVGYALLLMVLLKSDRIGGIDGIAILDAIVTSAVMSHWLHRRLARMAPASA
ncbi:hypothetical protein [Burkholderia pseudomultivorans]|uniref:hypothetical protein n=1 Tax=Burkholderia pseudomultivorans TaxID=1207504 RepID=UPI00075F4287|nr:hypothetical protein [Burkholderia pseudomultivorans]KWF11513.1 hypothetical protein WT55_10415 [Burkholderia pseudomultivorans]